MRSKKSTLRRIEERAGEEDDAFAVVYQVEIIFLL